MTKKYDTISAAVSNISLSLCLFLGVLNETFYLSCCKYPESKELQKQWNYNKESLLSFLEVVQTGVRGIVTDEKGGPLPQAYIEVAGISYLHPGEKNITTSALGEYWRLLAPGNYW